MDIGLKIRRNPNFHYIRYDPLRPTEELTHTQTYSESLRGKQFARINKKDQTYKYSKLN